MGRLPVGFTDDITIAVQFGNKAIDIDFPGVGRRAFRCGDGINPRPLQIHGGVGFIDHAAIITGPQTIVGTEIPFQRGFRYPSGKSRRRYRKQIYHATRRIRNLRILATSTHCPHRGELLTARFDINSSTISDMCTIVSHH